ncbi:MAG: LysM peptidoglycan-binding domain-containing protein [Thermoleophilaceae bacterium]|nr:LysM peptidoglycan-binding domain-containing protein [Thermoleophilaceae bacterium]
MKALFVRPLLGAIVLSALVLCSSASANVTRTVVTGESLWSIAEANGVSVAELAAANGVAADAYVIEGTDITIPPATGSAPAGSGGAPPALGSYIVRPGDTLTHIAQRSGLPMGAVAGMNGIDPAEPLLIGTVLKLPTGASVETSAPVPEQRVVPDAAPYPTDESVDSATIAQVAAEHGVPGSLAAAIAWQESGFSNSVVSTANARGVMQLLPGTWTWVNGSLASAPLNPSSALDNVRAGVLYLQQLLRDTGWDIRSTIASYYQGLGSVRSIGILPETQSYVEDVIALQPRFGG